MDSIIHDSQDLAGLPGDQSGPILIVIVTVVTLKSATRHRERADPARVAAYVAGGSMSADDAEKILSRPGRTSSGSATTDGWQTVSFRQHAGVWQKIQYRAGIADPVADARPVISRGLWVPRC